MTPIDVAIIAIATFAYTAIGGGFALSFYRRLGPNERLRAWHAGVGGVMWPVFGLALFGHWLGQGPSRTSMESNHD